MKPKIKFRLEVWETSLVFQVLEMDERFRSEKTFKASNGIIIGSINTPSIDDSDTSNLRGKYKRRDYWVSCLNYNTKEKAEETKAQILEALKEWAEKAPEFQEDKSTPEQEGSIYEF
jgi:hypothetical protein